MTTTDTYHLKWHSHSSHLYGAVASLLRSERFTDVVLCTLDGSQIPAHKFILSSCSAYLSSLFESQRSSTRMGGMIYVVLPPEVSTKALKILVEYMYKGETAVSNDILDIVLKAGETLKIRGLWRQDELDDCAPPENSTQYPQATVHKQPTKKPEEMQAITLKKDDKVIKTFSPTLTQQTSASLQRSMFLHGPPKLVFIKTAEGGTQAASLRPVTSKGQTILVAPAPPTDSSLVTSVTPTTSTITLATTTSLVDDSSDDAIPPRILRKTGTERKYGKRQKTEPAEQEEAKDADDADNSSASSKVSTQGSKESVGQIEAVHVKNEPAEWDTKSIEDADQSIAEMFHNELNVKPEPLDEDSEDDTLIYSPLSCELCAEVFTVPAAWVRHVQGHSNGDQNSRKRKMRSSSSDDDSMALLRCDLCQKHFLNPAEWVRHIQNTHTETELANANNSAPPKRHNRFTEGVQNKTCPHCSKVFPSHASLLIHLRTHTGERPFICGLCNKGFSVKSNLVRHLRTLHDHQESPPPGEREEPGPSNVKREP